MTMLQTLRSRRVESRQKIDSLLNVTNRDLTAAEASAFESLRTDIIALDERIAEVAEAERRSDLAAASRVQTGQTGPATGNGWSVTREPSTYEGRNGGPSFFGDLAQLAIRGYSPDVAGRMERHQLETRALSTSDGAGGDLAPPIWMVQEFVALARAARVTADRVRRAPLPTGTDVINIPKIATGTATAEQVTQNLAVQNTDATTTAISANVATIAGQQVVSVQLIEQSPVNVDQILLADLAADYAAKVDVFVLNNNATGKVGILNAAGTAAVTYTSASPTVSGLYSKLADAQQRIATARFLPADAVIMHPRRWAWITAASDSSNRPLVVPHDQGPYNAAAAMDAPSAEGFVGSLLGLPVFVDPNIPTTTGAGANQDPIIVGRFADAYLWEGNLNVESFRETKADQLSVLLRTYAYLAFTAARYPASFAIVNGTGNTPPVF